MDTDYLADRAGRGDEDSFTTLYGRIAPAMFAWASCRLTGPIRKTVDPEDLVQEVWWRALERFDSFESRGQGSFRAWVFGVASNVFREVLRRGIGSRDDDHARRHASLPPELHAQVTSITTDLARHEDALKIVESINALDPEDRQVALYCGLEGLSASRAADLMRPSTHEAVRKRWQRLRARLQDVPVWKSLLAD